jgi:bifunctional DNA-binding transcriptional regulator/antitoxin component of YhaV-PrlF toxin-antitoxin module
LNKPKPGYAGRRFASQCRIRGHAGEWYIRRQDRVNSRVIRIRPDGLSDDVGYVVANTNLIDVRPSENDPSLPGRHVSQVGPRGTVVIAPALRAAFGLTEGTFVIQEMRPEGVLIRPAVVTPVSVAAGQAAGVPLVTLLEGVNPENLHGEIDSGPAVGPETQ